MLLSELAVSEPSHYRSDFPTFAQPREVACFSRDADRGLHLDRRALRPYAPPSLPAPLDVGFDSFQPKDSADDPAPLKDIVTALSSRKITPQKGQFITFRRVARSNHPSLKPQALPASSHASLRPSLQKQLEQTDGHAVLA